MKARILLTFLCVLLPAIAGASNALKGHSSPYLAMHGGDPVQWREWGEAAIAEARSSGKPIYVSVGYFSCHWCHVMHRESYNDAAIAALLNSEFIPIKVDRELRPALDAALIDYVERSQGVAGWPLNVFLTPDGYPLYGLIYQPPENFKRILEAIAGEWKAKPGELGEAARQAYADPGPVTPRRVQVGDGVGALARGFVDQALRAADVMAGGFGNQNKFPSVPQLRALLALHGADGRDDARGVLEYALFMMASQGLRDHLLGGFFRYTVDPSWQIPHFEKMLYDNAQLASLYLDAADSLDRDGLRKVAWQTLDFMLKHMRADNGGFIASLSAVDASGEEGGSYLWGKQELRALLSADEYRLALAAWGLDEASPNEGGYLPVQKREVRDIASELKMSPERLAGLFQSITAKLSAVRETRRPPRDDKVLAAWNGLALSALARAVQVGDEPRYRAAGDELAGLLSSSLWDGKRLVRAVGASGPIGKAGLEDYAYVARGLLDWARATDDRAATATAATLIRRAWVLFRVEGGWRATSDALLPIARPEPSLADGPMFSPSAILIEATLDLTADAPDDPLRPQALAALGEVAEGMDEAPFFHATQIRVLHRFASGPDGAQ
ncbi:MAG: thioredoxin domain-containing protein [Gammaproteobacteria bacterium]